MHLLRKNRVHLFPMRANSQHSRATHHGCPVVCNAAHMRNHLTMKNLLAGILVFVITTSPAFAADISNSSEFQSNGINQWINWYPSDWAAPSSVQEIADQIIAEVKTVDDLPRCIHNWICENIYYDVEAEQQGIYTALSAADVLQNQKGVCEGIANLTQNLFLCVNIPCIKVWGVAIATDDSWDTTVVNLNRVNHTWNEYYWNGQWLTIDCTADMGNKYIDGEYNTVSWQEKYLAPDEKSFATTHLRLQRGFDLPQDIPDDWAMEEIRQAMDAGGIPLFLLCNYRTAVTGDEFGMITGLECSGNTPITRLEAATLLASRIKTTYTATTPYQDISECKDIERYALGLLYESGLMQGDGILFHPKAELTRQEAILISARMRGNDLCI